MAKVSNLKIALQSGTDNNYFASWDFNETTSSTSGSNSIKVGDLVSIKAGATWYNGTAISSWVFNDKWYVTQISGNRAILGKNQSGSNNIVSPIHTKYLSGGSASSGSSTDLSKTLDHYTVEWYYSTGDGVWFSGGSSDVKNRNALYSPPENATRIKVKVKPVSKTYKSGDTEKSYWTGSWVTKDHYISHSPPKTPSTPSVKVEKYTLTASIENIDDVRTDKIQFQVYEENTKVKTGTVTVITQRASYSCSVGAGKKYRVRCRAVNLVGTSELYGEWTAFSSEVSTIPSGVDPKIRCTADSETSVKLTWRGVATAKSYDIQYTTKKEYFDTSGEVSSTSVDKNVAYITGLESGREWFFRIRAVNDQGNSGWSSIVSTIIGTTPEPPTTWSLTTTGMVGDDVTLYWTHNSEDNSKQTSAQIHIDINGSVDIVTVTNSQDEDDDEPIHSYTFNPDPELIADGAKILWKVRTKGVVKSYSDWSTLRTINFYAPPTLDVSVSTNEEELIDTLPIEVTATAGPVTQEPTNYHVMVTAKDTYETVDATGSPMFVTAGTEIYSRIFNVSDNPFMLSLSAGDILLENNQRYELRVTASMDSGLIAESTTQLEINWTDYDYMPDASVGIDLNTLSAYVTPFCKDSDDNLIDNVTLSVYRREANGTFTELITGLANTGVDTVTDPHPSLDYARYRIVARSVDTGSISYEDIPGTFVGEPSIVIQWDEQWVNFDYTDDAEPETPPWTGSMVKLPYNVDISEKRSLDVSLVKYIGREHPVSYYGTQRGESASWSTAIDKSDKETIYALRRLSSWPGNVYVREPSGTGYWAHISVTFPIKHKELTIPVSFDITRVEGGI